MSGGHFDYDQDKVHKCAKMLFDLIREQEMPNRFSEEHDFLYSEETLKEFKNGLEYVEKAYIYLQRIDLLVCGDDGEECFHKRLKEELCGKAESNLK